MSDMSGFPQIYIDVPPKRTFWRTARSSIIIFVIICMIGTILFGFWSKKHIDGSGSETPVSFVVPKNQVFADTVKQLQKEKIIKSTFVFTWYAKFRNFSSVQAGEYEGLVTNQSMDTIISIFKAGPLPPKYSEITIPEGFWLSDLRTRISQKYPAMTPDIINETLANISSVYQPVGKPIDGFLFPATYTVLDKDREDATKLLTQMVQKFDEVAKKVGIEETSTLLKGKTGSYMMTPYDVIIVASLIESEAGVDGDRAKIAQVIYNRLEQGMKLEIDATTIFSTGSHVTELTKSQLDSNSPYNTRKVKGLPPTPISLPGEASLYAALHPEEGDWLFYVLAASDGTHAFFESYDDFQEQVAKSQREGLF